LVKGDYWTSDPSIPNDVYEKEIKGAFKGNPPKRPDILLKHKIDPINWIIDAKYSEKSKLEGTPKTDYQHQMFAYAFLTQGLEEGNPLWTNQMALVYVSKYSNFLHDKGKKINGWNPSSKPPRLHQAACIFPKIEDVNSLDNWNLYIMKLSKQLKELLNFKEIEES
jgi:hypothetical protein